MRRITRYIVLGMVLAGLSSAPAVSLAYDEKDIEITDSTSYLEFSSQIGIWATRASHYSLDMLGISEMEFNGTYTYGENEQLWSFQTEPKIRKIDPSGPSNDKLRDGDYIVAIDGMLITTGKAGVRFANLVAGKAVELEVRRSGGKRTLTVTPRALPPLEIPLEITVLCTEQLNRENAVTVETGKVFVPELAQLIEKAEKREKELCAETKELGILASSEYLDRAPRGWVGFGLSFAGSIRKNDEGEPADWLFFELPSIKSIRPGSPADMAGLKVGDVLLEIDGKKLDSQKGSNLFSRMEPGQVVVWKVRRGSETFKVETKAAVRPDSGRSGSKRGSSDSDTLQPLRYTGSLGNIEIEIRGGQGARVDVDEGIGETLIRLGDSMVRLRKREWR